MPEQSKIPEPTGKAFIASLPDRVKAGLLLERALDDIAYALEVSARLGRPNTTDLARSIRQLDVPALLALHPEQARQLLQELAVATEDLLAYLKR